MAESNSNTVNDSFKDDDERKLCTVFFGICGHKTEM